MFRSPLCSRVYAKLALSLGLLGVAIGGMKAMAQEVTDRKMQAINQEILRTHKSLLPDLRDLNFHWKGRPSEKGIMPGLGDLGCQLILFDTTTNEVEKIKVPTFQNSDLFYLEGTLVAFVLRPIDDLKQKKELVIQLPLDTAYEKAKQLNDQFNKLIGQCRKKWQYLYELAFKIETKNRHYHSCQLEGSKEVHSFISPADADFSQFLRYVDYANVTLLDKDVMEYVDDLDGLFTDKAVKRADKAGEIIRRIQYYMPGLMEFMINEPRYLTFINDVESLNDVNLNREMEKIKGFISDVKRHYLRNIILDGQGAHKNARIMETMKKMLKRNLNFLDAELAYELQEAIIRKNVPFTFTSLEGKSMVKMITHFKMKSLGPMSMPHTVDAHILKELLDYNGWSTNYSILAVDRARRFLDVQGYKQQSSLVEELWQKIKEKYQKGEWAANSEHLNFLSQNPELLEELSWQQIQKVSPESGLPGIQEELEQIRAGWLKARKNVYDRNIKIALDAFADDVSGAESERPVLDYGPIAQKALHAAYDLPGGLKEVPSVHLKNILRHILPLGFSEGISDSLEELFGERLPELMEHMKLSAKNLEALFGDQLSRIFKEGGPSSQEFYDYARQENELRYLLAVTISKLQMKAQSAKEREDQEEVDLIKEQMAQLVPYSEDVHFRAFLMFQLYKKANPDKWKDEFSMVRDDRQGLANQKLGLDFDTYGRYAAIGEVLEEFMKYERDLPKYPKRNDLRGKAMKVFQRKMEELVKGDEPSKQALFGQLKALAKETPTFPAEAEIEGLPTNLYQELTMFRTYFEATHFPPQKD